MTKASHPRFLHLQPSVISCLVSSLHAIQQKLLKSDNIPTPHPPPTKTDLLVCLTGKTQLKKTKQSSDL